MTISKGELSKRKTRTSRTGDQIFISIEAVSNRTDVKLHGNYTTTGDTFRALQALLSLMIQVGAKTR
jgi:hypothetical protein